MNSNPHVKLRPQKSSISPLSFVGTSVMYRYSIILRYIWFRHRSFHSIKYRPPTLPPLGRRGRRPQETQGSTRVCLHRIAHGKTGIEGCRDIAVGVLPAPVLYGKQNQTTPVLCHSVPHLPTNWLSYLSPITSFSLLFLLSPQLPLHKPNTSLKLPTNDCQTSCQGHGRVLRSPLVLARSVRLSLDKRPLAHPSDTTRLINSPSQKVAGQITTASSNTTFLYSPSPPVSPLQPTTRTATTQSKVRSHPSPSPSKLIPSPLVQIANTTLASTRPQPCPSQSPSASISPSISPSTLPPTPCRFTHPPPVSSHPAPCSLFPKRKPAAPPATTPVPIPSLTPISPREVGGSASIPQRHATIPPSTPCSSALITRRCTSHPSPPGALLVPRFPIHHFLVLPYQTPYHPANSQIGYPKFSHPATRQSPPPSPKQPRSAKSDDHVRPWLGSVRAQSRGWTSGVGCVRGAAREPSEGAVRCHVAGRQM